MRTFGVRSCHHAFPLRSSVRLKCRLTVRSALPGAPRSRGADNHAPYARSNDDAAIEHRPELLFQGTCCGSLLESSGVLMIRISFFSAAVAILMSFCQGSSAHAAGPEELIEAVKVALGKNFNTDWSGLDALPGIKWAPLPPTSLQNCLPDGGCFARQGAAKFGDHSMTVIASGARTFVTNIYFRSNARAMGETNVLDALKQAGFASELARCPVKGTIGGTNWYRLESASTNPGVVSV